MSPGAAFVFLMAGPATNAVTFTVVSKELGQKASIIYVLSIAVMSVLMGVILDNIWPHMKVMMPSAVHHSQMLPYSLEVASSVVLFVLIAFSSLRGLARGQESWIYDKSGIGEWIFVLRCPGDIFCRYQSN